MNIKTLRTALCALIFGFFFNSHAQSYVTYNHDDAKMNHITVQEIGAGGLTPAFYYDVFHNSIRNQQLQRTNLDSVHWQV